MKLSRFLAIAAACGCGAFTPVVAATPGTANGPGRKPAFHGCWDLVLTPLHIHRGSDDTVRMCLHENGFGTKSYSNGMHSGSEGLRWRMVGDNLATRLYIDEDGTLESRCRFRIVSEQWLDLHDCSINGETIEKSYWLLGCTDLDESDYHCLNP